jgi:hypothetical protein
MCWPLTSFGQKLDTTWSAMCHSAPLVTKLSLHLTHMVLQSIHCRVIRSSINRGTYWFFYIYLTHVLAASLDGEPPKQVIQQKIIQQYIYHTTRHKSMKVCNLHTTIHSLHTRMTIRHTTQSRCRVKASATALALTGSSHV